MENHRRTRLRRVTPMRTFPAWKASPNLARVLVSNFSELSFAPRKRSQRRPLFPRRPNSAGTGWERQLASTTEAASSWHRRAKASGHVSQWKRNPWRLVNPDAFVNSICRAG